VDRLPEPYRLAVVLVCLEGLSQEEAARRLGWTAGQVKGRLERGRKRLHAAEKGTFIIIPLRRSGIMMNVPFIRPPLSAVIPTAEERAAKAEERVRELEAELRRRNGEASSEAT
jgi:hypothetical protein